MVTQSVRKERTRLHLMTAARYLFGKNGYEATKMDDVAGRAGVAKGALYHHFKSKHDLFEAVLFEISSDIATQVQSELRLDNNLVETMNAGVRIFFGLCSEQEIFQILLKDGPAVLGWKRWREIDNQNFGGTVRAVLTAGMEGGILKSQPIDPLTNLLIGAISEAAMDCANQESFETAARDYIASLEMLIEGLKVDQ